METEFGSSEGFYGRVTYEGVIFTQLIRIGYVSSRLFITSDGSWQTNVLNYYSSVRSLESLVEPYMTPDDKEKLANLIKESTTKHNSLKISKKSLKEINYRNMMETINLSNKILKLIIRSLQNIGLLIPTEISITIGEEGEETEKEETNLETPKN